MRILHVIPSVAAVRGGPSQAALELVAELKKRGFETEIATTNDNGPVTLDVPLGRVTEFCGAPVRFFHRFSPPVRPLREFAISLPFARWLKSHVREFSIVHVHALFSFTSSISMKLARDFKVPYINRPSGLLCRWSLRQSAARKQMFLKLFDRANLDNCTALEFTAEQEQEETGDLKLKAKSFVMPYGIHMALETPDARKQLREKLKLREADRVVLFLSRIHPKKGIHHLLSAALTLQDRSVHYVIAGAGDSKYETDLKQMAAQGPLKERVHFVGFASGEWKNTLLQGADLFALPSHSESFAIAVMEALAAGLPVITTRDVPMAFLVEKFNLGSICQPEARSVAAALMAQLAALTAEDEARNRKSTAVRLMRDNFSWGSIGMRMAAAYQQILEGHHPSSFRMEDIK